MVQQTKGRDKVHSACNKERTHDLRMDAAGHDRKRLAPQLRQVDGKLRRLHAAATRHRPVTMRNKGMMTQNLIMAVHVSL